MALLLYLSRNDFDEYFAVLYPVYFIPANTICTNEYCICTQMKMKITGKASETRAIHIMLFKLRISRVI